MSLSTRILLFLALLVALGRPLWARGNGGPPDSLRPEERELFDLEALDDEPAARDSLHAAQSPGYGWLDSIYGSAAADSLHRFEHRRPDSQGSAAGPDSSGEAWPLFPARRLPLQSLSLQDLLRANPLPDSENESWTDIARVDTLIALSLLQVRKEAWPCYYPYSDLWIYIWRGWGQLVLDDREEEYSPGRIFQIPAATVHHLRNISGAPTVALVWSSPPVTDSLRVRIVPDEVLEKMQADSLRTRQMQERILYRSPGR